VVVATRPPGAHIPVAIEALQRGVHVYVEKPLAASLADAMRGFQAAREAGKTLCAYQNRRFEIAFMAFKEALDTGVVGEPGVIVRHTNCGVEPDDFLDFGSHIFDQIVCLIGDRTIVEVSGAVQQPGMKYDVGSFGWYHAEVRCDDGLVAIAEKLPYPEQRSFFYAAGDKGMFQHDWCDSRNDILRKMTKRMGATVPPVWCAGFLGEHFPGFHDGPDATFYHLCYKRMHEHLVEGAPPPVPAADTLRAFALMEAMMESAITGKAVSFVEPAL
jgi:predicted dehydrogenase